jgi:hypothetical protein
MAVVSVSGTLAKSEINVPLPNKKLPEMLANDVMLPVTARSTPMLPSSLDKVAAETVPLYVAVLPLVNI